MAISLQSWWMKIHVPANFVGYGAFALSAMLGVALGVVLMPQLASARAKQDDERYSAMLDWGLRLDEYTVEPVHRANWYWEVGMRDDQVADAAAELAMSLAQGPSVTLGYIKRNINNAETLSLEACFDAESAHHTRCGETADHREAAKAFMEKRKAVFKGH